LQLSVTVSESVDEDDSEEVAERHGVKIESRFSPPMSRGCASRATADTRDGFGAAMSIAIADLAGVWRRRKRNAD
jgi:hypothetical protein